MMSENINYLLVSLSPKGIYSKYPGLEKSAIWLPRTSRFSSGQVDFSFPNAWWEGIRSARKIINRTTLPRALRLFQGKKNLKATSPMGKLEFKVFSNHGSPLVIPYFTVMFCKLICTWHFSFFVISRFFFSFRQEIRSSCFADLRCGNTISHIDHQGRCIFICFRVNFEDLVIDQSITVSCFYFALSEHQFQWWRRIYLPSN